MKVRLYHDSLRLRLNADEVEQLQTTGIVTGSTQFGPRQSLTCRISAAPTTTAIRAEFRGGNILVSVPLPQVQHWAATDEVGMSAVQPVGGSQSLHILIEKDFECLHQEDSEPGVRLYPNPAAVVTRSAPL